MYFDALTLACVADELRQTVLGGRVQRVLLPDALSLGLEIYARQQRHYLLASAHAELGRLVLSDEKLRRGVDKATGLLLLLRKYVRGAILTAIEQPAFERILRLEFDHPESGCTELIVEIMGRHSNLILVGPDSQVLDAAKRVGPHLSSVRPIVPNQPYVPPPPQAKLPPSDLTEYRLRQMLSAADEGAQVWQVLVGSLQGMSPLLAREITFRALGQPRARVAQVERLTPLLDTLAELLAPLDNGQWQPSVALENGQPAVYAPYRLSHRGNLRPMPSISQAIEAYTAAAAQADPFGSAQGRPYAAAKRPVAEAIAHARARLERRLEALERSMHEAADADRWRDWGTWILTYAHTVERGQAELVADTGDGEVRIIPLDPAKSAVDNAQEYFARYRKAQRAVEDGPARIQQVCLAIDDLEQIETDLALAESRPEIEAVRATLVEAGHVKLRQQKQSKTRASQPLALTSPDGLTILVGRNSRQNDEVTFRRAGGDDWWFHARGVPGAHVIVQADGKSLPQPTIQRAAALAAYYSRLRGETDVPVDYTQRRYVRRIRGAAPGLVTYSHEQTTRVAPHSPEDRP
jgi:predicted ribosome quality control (RQC) complex YloA/Tae2 family protein